MIGFNKVLRGFDRVLIGRVVGPTSVVSFSVPSRKVLNWTRPASGPGGFLQYQRDPEVVFLPSGFWRPGAPAKTTHLPEHVWCFGLGTQASRKPLGQRTTSAGYLKAVLPDFLGCVFEVWPMGPGKALKHVRGEAPHLFEGPRGRPDLKDEPPKSGQTAYRYPHRDPFESCVDISFGTVRSSCRLLHTGAPRSPPCSPVA